MPRRPGTVAPPIHFAGKSDEDTELLTPDEWRREFERTWAALSGVQ
jgi:hypothetical protein